MLTAVRGGLGFLSRLPVGHDSESWEAFTSRPVVFPLVGYLLGGLLVVPLLIPAPVPTVAFLFVLWLYFLTGINHLDGVADVGDALAVHGDAAERLAVMKDPDLGVGGTLSVVVVIVGIALAGLSLASVPDTLVVLVITAEVGAKCTMALLVCLGSAPHEGLGAVMTSESNTWDAVLPLVVSVPAAALTWPSPVAAVTLGASLFAGALTSRFASRLFGGPNGDVFGASNELARLAGLHAGVIAWMHL